MALLNDAADFKKLDIRMIERNLARGIITPTEAEAAVLALPDDAENADWVSLDDLTDENSDNQS